MHQDNAIRLGNAAAQKATIDEWRAKGWPVTQVMLDDLEAQELREQENAAIRTAREKQTADRRAAEQAADLAQLDADLRAETLSAFILAGGTSAEFDKEWPGLRVKIIEQRTLAQVSAPASVIAKKLAGGMYGL